MENEILDLPDPNEPNEHYELATSGTRFLNSIIDMVAYYLAAFIIGIILAAVGFDLSAFVSGVGSYIFSFSILIGYYTISEGAMNGKTAGKWITKTRAIQEDGSPLGWDKALTRSLCRLIPFDALSFLGSSTGWHDSMTKTVVIKDNR